MWALCRMVGVKNNFSSMFCAVIKRRKELFFIASSCEATKLTTFRADKNNIISSLIKFMKNHCSDTASNELRNSFIRVIQPEICIIKHCCIFTGISHDLCYSFYRYHLVYIFLFLRHVPHI